MKPKKKKKKKKSAREASHAWSWEESKAEKTVEYVLMPANNDTRSDWSLVLISRKISTCARMLLNYEILVAVS